MAQGVQVQAPPALNDENSSSTTAVLRANNKPGAPPLQLSARKAFGNISSNLSKQPTARRALGDISNSAAKPPAGRTASKATSNLFAMPQKAAAAAAPAPAVPAAADKASSTPASTAQATTSTTASATNSSKPAWWEELEPERVAGKTWEQQLAQEDAAVDAEAKQAADQIWQAVFRGGSGGMFGFLVGVLTRSRTTAVPAGSLLVCGGGLVRRISWSSQFAGSVWAPAQAAGSDCHASTVYLHAGSLEPKRPQLYLNPAAKRMAQCCAAATAAAACTQARPPSKGQESEEEDDTSYPPVEAPCRQLEGPCNLAPLPDVARESSPPYRRPEQLAGFACPLDPWEPVLALLLSSVVTTPRALT